MSRIKVISVCLDDYIVDLLDKVKESRRDQSRSNTIRTMLLMQLAQMSFLTSEEKKALGIKEIQPEETLKRQQKAEGAQVCGPAPTAPTIHPREVNALDR